MMQNSIIGYIVGVIICFVEFIKYRLASI